MQWWRTVLWKEILGLALLYFDFILDIVFLVHLWNNGFRGYFFGFALTVLVISVMCVNVLASVGIWDLMHEFGTPVYHSLNLNSMLHRKTLWNVAFVSLGMLALLPLVLFIITMKAVYACSKPSAPAGAEDALWKVFRADSPSAAVKVVQSALEAGPLLYLKAYYVFLYAKLCPINWPVMLGLAVNAVSTLFGLREDLIPGKRLQPLAISVAAINLSLRLTIILCLGKGTERICFFIPIGVAVLLTMIWGSYLYIGLPLWPCQIPQSYIDAKPISMFDNIMSSFMYTLYQPPIDTHTAVSIAPFTVTAIIITCLKVTPLGIRILMPFAGTIGLLPPVLWWKLFRVQQQ